MIKMNDPILNGPDYHRCGRDFNYARCSVNPSDWSTNAPQNGPCCSASSFCGSTSAHCDSGIDFREIVSSDAWEVQRGSYISGLIQTKEINNLDEAQKKCVSNRKCGGITLSGNKYELRVGKEFQNSPGDEISWLKKGS